MLSKESCWNAVASRDARYDGRFVFGVVSTGIYCRPSCRSRLPLRKNVRFYRNATEAESDGLRPCLKCCPSTAATVDRNLELVRAACRFIDDHLDEKLDLATLAARAGMSRFHFQRAFKTALGVTPRDYIENRRFGKLKSRLRQSKGVTEAIYASGFESSSRVYDRADRAFGMTPKQYRDGGKGISITYVTVSTRFGLMMIGATERGISFLQFGERISDLLSMLKGEYPEAHLQPMQEPHHPEFEKWVAAVKEYLEGDSTDLNLPLDIRATAFQIKVWTYLQSIPCGEQRSYKDVAIAIGQPTAARAVARACASNKIAILIPCHRVIHGSGDRGGYKWGLSRKEGLLEHEAASRRT